jgi:hypothetical protein
VKKVEFFQGATLLGSDDPSPVEFILNDVAAGSYSFTAIATDDDDAQTTSGAIAVTVNPPPNQAPTVSLTDPADGASFTAPATIMLQATAADADGTVKTVDFFNGTTFFGTDDASPFELELSEVAAGSYSFTAVATDDDDAQTTSGAITVTVNPAPPPPPPPNQAPTVSLTDPADGDTFTAPATITLQATADDADGTVKKVDFFHGTTLLGTDEASPYEFTWSDVGPGNYSLTAVATDNAAAATISAVVDVTVCRHDARPIAKRGGGNASVDTNKKPMGCPKPRSPADTPE